MASQLGSVTVSSVPDEQAGEVGGLQNNPDVPEGVATQAQTELASGIEFISDEDLKTALSDANVPPATADAVLDTNEQSRIDGLRVAVSILALMSLVALPFTRGIPTVQPGEESAARSAST